MQKKQWCTCNELPIKHKHSSFSGPIRGIQTSEIKTNSAWCHKLINRETYNALLESATIAKKWIVQTDAYKSGSGFSTEVVRKLSQAISDAAVQP